VNFWFNMHGSNLGSLSVKVVPANNTNSSTTIWQLGQDKGTAWINGQVAFSSKVPFYVRIYSVEFLSLQNICKLFFFLWKLHGITVFISLSNPYQWIRPLHIYFILIIVIKLGICFWIYKNLLITKSPNIDIMKTFN
jgi:hypothetical protein